MIKDFSVKKILKYSALLLIVFLFYLFPEKQVVQKNESTFNEQNIKYHDIFLMDKNGYISAREYVRLRISEYEEIIKEYKDM